MSTTIICPNCAHEFQPTDAIRDELEKQLRAQMKEWQKKKEEETQKTISEQKEKLTAQIQEQLRKQISDDYEVQLKTLQMAEADKDSKLKIAREKELEFIKREQELRSKEKELDIQLQTMLLEERNRLTELVRKEQDEQNKVKDQEVQMKMKELEKQLDDQRKLAEEMRRKAEQGSMQLQGEVQELALEEMLRFAFPFDVVEEVGKGIRGADCVLKVRNQFGQECGKILFESKRTKDFSADWIEKLKADTRVLSADVAVIVTQAMPRDMESFGERDGVWICTFSEAKAMVSVLRDLVIKVYNAAKSHDNKGDKMTLLYNYLISHEFSGQWQAIREGFMSMKISIQKERDQMEKLWKSREKQLEKVLLNAAHIQGSIEGIAGMDVIDMNLLSEENNYLLD